MLGQPSAASCRCRTATPGHPTRRSIRRAATLHGNSDGLSATCQADKKRGWERRFQHSIIVLDRQGNLVGESRLDELFSKLPCGRGPHQIKISPYDQQKHVWIIDDQLHMIYRFTQEGKLVSNKGPLGVRGRGPNTLTGRPTSRGCPTEPTSSPMATAAHASSSTTPMTTSSWTGGGRPRVRQPGAERMEYRPQHRDNPDRRLHVIDRGHARMQVFDENGKFLDMWPLNHRSGLPISPPSW